MTNFQASLAEYETNSGFPGAAPVPGAGNLMTGNPQVPSNLPDQNLPGNQNTGAQLLATQLSNGNISANSVPTNVLSAPGTDSLLAQMSRGQVILKDSTYGMAQFTPGNAAPAPGAPTTQPVTAGVASAASGLTYPAPGSQNYTGN
jgi:hypothetical protein